MSEFKEDEIVKTRGDIGGMTFKICEIHNDWYCSAKQMFFGFAVGKLRHFNLAVFEKSGKSIEFKEIQ
jgi:hypothetical protein